ncbi:RNA polymerase sigma-70 factor (ECF subfamily) [Allocatelliglobosispora scoriae]|uniref:RNA polymerase sigma-70 factor (ECF subfamily) n=1 Tax=Allocatelliglobosispora scoriae TaxID=643052 RepID=A0A841BIT1_9ACTN|nr:RNA polymerase sigma factor [Allocatelliglobosispora scoriae]MBB5869027.1 RNA polymerase sigma-70 factor (ECF subfamily) [Allocatelliglobosispora scoriae]
MESNIRERVRSGDPSVFAELFDRYAKAVYNHAFRLTANWAVTEDVMSATFLQAWRSRARVSDEGGSLRPWLLGIATNEARNHVRSNRRYRAAAAALPVEPPTPDHAEQVAGQLDDARRIRAAVAALALLRPHEREVITLCLWEGLDYESAARALGVPVGTVRSRLSRGRARLGKLVDAQLHGNPSAPAGQTTGENGSRPAQEGNR